MGILGAIVKAATVKAVAKAAEGAVESIAMHAENAAVAKAKAQKEAEKEARREKQEVRREERLAQKELLKENIPCLFAPKNASDFIRRDYEEVINELRAHGFENIHLLEKKDIRNNWLERADHHKIIEITIEGMDDFKKRTAFRMGARVVITYHEYR